MKRFKHKYDVTLLDIDKRFRLPIHSLEGIFTDAIGRFMGTAGIGPDDLIKDGMAWVITEFSFTLSGRIPRWKEIFTVETWICEISAVRVFVDYRMLDGDDKVFAQGSSTWVVIDLDSRKPVPTNQLSGLDTLFDSANAEHHKSHRFLSDGETIATHSHRITITETDFNGHMNNQSYVKIAISMASAQFMATHVIKDFHVRFGRESFLGEALQCRLSIVGEGTYLSVISREDDGSEICSMESSWNPINIVNTNRDN